MQNDYEKFTNLYSLSKTLRFELKPIWKTKKLLDEKNSEIFPNDKRILEIYQDIIKPCMNKLHSYFIEASLWDIDIKLPDDILSKYKKDKKDFEKIQKKLAKNIKEYMWNYNFYNAKWYQQLKDGKTILWKKWEIWLLSEIFGKEIYENSQYKDLNWKTYKELIEKYFKWFFTYLSTFNENRNNLYKDDLKWSRITSRILKDNLPRFLENIIVYKSKLKEKLNLTDDEKQIFDINNFHKYLNQTWIDNYNEISWDINSKINEYNQQNNLKGSKKIPYLQILYKQILWESKKQDILDFVENIIESEDELENTLEQFIKQENDKTKIIEDIFYKFDIDKFKNEYDLSWTYLKRWSLKVFSNRYLNNWSVLESLLPKRDNKWKEKKWKTKDDVISLADIKESLDNVSMERNDLFKKWIIKWLKTNFDEFITLIFEDLQKLIKEKENSKEILKKTLLEWDFKENIKSEKTEYKDQEYKPKQTIKDYLDKVLGIYGIVNYFSLQKWQFENKENIDKEDKDIFFYTKLDKFLLDYYPFKIYNSIRNYLTKKPYKQNKVKLNFDNSTLLNGWDKNKESSNYGVILRKDNKYFLAVMKKWDTNIFDKSKFSDIYNIDWDYYEKMDYKLLPWPNKMLPKVFFSKSKIDFFQPDKEILDIREKETFKQWNNFSLQDLHKWIDFMKKSIYKHPEWKNYNFNFKKTEEYKNIKDFYANVENQWYKLTFSKVNKQKVDKLIEDENLYIFQIYNKDFSTYAHGKPNLHTLYFKALFEKENFDKWPIFKLNWKAEIFFREKSNIKKEIRKLKDWSEIVDHKRYLKHKLLFHTPITINFINKWVNPKFWEMNDMVKKHIKENDVNFIWIDRWEKNLLYICLIDKNWNIKEVKSLNEIMWVNYKDKLVDKEKWRDQERKSWEEIETIKELKEWYISQVVHYVAKMAVENDAIIILENLNGWFKRSRQKVERQVYQKFELALAKKLNYLVFKEKNKDEIWSYYNAYQFTPIIETFWNIRNQTWIIFYTQAAYTSTTCPVCWFRKKIYIRYESKKKSKDFIDKLNISYNGNDYFFTYSLKDLKKELKNKKWVNIEKTEFTVSTKNQERIKTYKDKYNKWIIIQTYIIKQEFDQLFNQYNLDKNNLKEEIKNKDLDSKFYKAFIYKFNLLLQLRNSKTDENIDFIQCPSCGFDSRNTFQWKDFDADANGAYNIARKGIMIADKIKNDEKSLWITNNEWDNFVQK